MPGNLEEVADFVDHRTVIKDRVMEFSPDAAKLMEVNLGTLEPGSAIVATIGLDNNYPAPQVNFGDQTNVNFFYIVGKEHYSRLPPCRPDAKSTDGRLVSPDSEEPSTYKLTVVVSEGFGFCETAQDYGYINTGLFDKQLDISKPIYFMLFSDPTITKKMVIHYVSLVVQ